MRARAPIGALYDEREFGKALREIMLLADRVNEYVDQHKPWELAKDDGAAPRCTTCARVCIEAFRLLTIYLKPVLPALAGAASRPSCASRRSRFDDARPALGAHRSAPTGT